MRLLVAHASMQFSDTPRRQRDDVETLFDRARAYDYDWITGTEAGPGNQPLRAALDREARACGYRPWWHPASDTWICVRQRLIDGDWTTHWQQVFDGQAGRYTAKGVVAVGFDNDVIGRVNVIAGHYLTRGRPNAAVPSQRVNLTKNKRLATAIGAYATEVGRGSALVFYGGDQNIVDRSADTFLGEPLTSTWDELGKWPDTGHGNIDVIASYDRDRRVQAIQSRVLNDERLPLHTDHFLIEATFDVAPLPNGA